MEALDARSARALPPPDPTRVLVAGAETGGRCALVERIEVQGGSPPWHPHHRQDGALEAPEGVLRARAAGCRVGGEEPHGGYNDGPPRNL